MIDDPIGSTLDSVLLNLDPKATISRLSDHERNFGRVEGKALSNLSEFESRYIRLGASRILETFAVLSGPAFRQVADRLRRRRRLEFRLRVVNAKLKEPRYLQD
jgi:hypothetical protein